jgi:hypothetical protein
MRREMKIKLQAYLIWTLAAVAWPAAGSPSANTNAPVPSVFTMPSNPGEGRDPFFPNSVRPYAESQSHIKHQVDVTSLQIKGISQIAGQLYVIINNHTFGAGDEGDVITPQGRIHLKCLSIGADSVLVESGGMQHILKFSNQP